MNFVLACLLVAACMLVPFIVTWRAQRIYGPSKIAFMFGSVYLLLYTVVVAIPYYFQGYSHVAPGRESEPLGLTAFLPIAFISYMLTFVDFGFAWIVVSICLLIAGVQQVAPCWILL